MSDAYRFGARPRAARYVPPPPRRRTRVPAPVLLIGFVMLLAAYGGRLFMPVPAPQQGPAPAVLTDVRAIDGDTLRAGAERIRLVGIDAPEKAQSCRDARGEAYACGLAAGERLAALVAQGPVACASHGRDRYGRTLATCSAGGVADIGRVMVREGYAVSFMDRDGRYLADESAARDQGLGLWRGAFERPADWRKRHRHPD
ncbi:MAG TPA: thermonuclease family protein [Pseudolabrys sp.]|nr:thermonuclease family protein [Pseudolabrys sp.]